MKGVILAGGVGSRLFPLTYATNKHLLPVYDRPMVYYPIQTLVRAGIKDILIVVGGSHAGDFVRVLRNGDEFGVKHLEYAYQDKEGGISHALALAEDFADKKPVAVILGDNCTDADIKKDVASFKKGAKVFLKEVPDPERFGVAKFDKNKSLVKIVEKPGKVFPGPTPSNLAATGLYIFDGSAYDRIRTIKPSKRGELEVTDLINTYIKDKLIAWSKLKGFWRDAGTFDTLLEVGNYWAGKK